MMYMDMAIMDIWNIRLDNVSILCPMKWIYNIWRFTSKFSKVFQSILGIFGSTQLRLVFENCCELDPALVYHKKYFPQHDIKFDRKHCANFMVCLWQNNVLSYKILSLPALSSVLYCWMLEHGKCTKVYSVFPIR